MEFINKAVDSCEVYQKKDKKGNGYVLCAKQIFASGKHYTSFVAWSPVPFIGVLQEDAIPEKSGK